MSKSNDLTEAVQKLTASISSFEFQMQQVTKPLVDFSKVYNSQMLDQVSIVGKLAEEASQRLSEAILPVIQNLSSNNRLDLEFPISEHIAQSLSTMPQKVRMVMPVNYEISNMKSNLVVREQSKEGKEDKVTWRDAIAIIGVLIALLSFLNDLSDKDVSPESFKARQEIKTEVNQTINNIVNIYYIDFPNDLPSSSDDQPGNERPDSVQ